MAAFVAFVAQFDNASGYGVAYSSTHFTKHDGHPEVVHGHGHHVDYHVRLEWMIINT